MSRDVPKDSDLGRTYVPVRRKRMSANYQILNVVRVEGE